MMIFSDWLIITSMNFLINIKQKIQNYVALYGFLQKYLFSICNYILDIISNINLSCYRRWGGVLYFYFDAT